MTVNDLYRFMPSAARGMNTTCERATLRKYLLEYGDTFMADGKLWALVSKHIGAGVYRINAAEVLFAGGIPIQPETKGE